MRLQPADWFLNVLHVIVCMCVGPRCVLQFAWVSITAKVTESHTVSSSLLLGYMIHTACKPFEGASFSSIIITIVPEWGCRLGWAGHMVLPLGHMMLDGNARLCVVYY